MYGPLNKHSLNLIAVKLDCLDSTKTKVTSATGFFVSRDNNLSLYTCWHVVTGIPSWQPLTFSRVSWNRDRRFLSISAQNVEKLTSDDGVPMGEAIGGLRRFELPLYDDADIPTWHQDKREVPHEDLNRIHIHVPCWHDAVAFPLENDQPLSPLQVIRDSHLFSHTRKIGPNRFQGRSYSPGDRVFIVGYPHGFSAAGQNQPAAIVLIRHVAATSFRQEGLLGRQILLDGPCAPGMSGSPVFVETDLGLQLFGIYTNIIFPDNPGGTADKNTALGVVTELTQSWESIPLVPQSEVGKDQR